MIGYLTPLISQIEVLQIINQETLQTVKFYLSWFGVYHVNEDILVECNSDIADYSITNQPVVDAIAEENNLL